MEAETKIEDDPAEAAARLEAALERIARVATQRVIDAVGRGADTGELEVAAEAMIPAELGARLDTIIAKLRSALGERPSDHTTL